NTLLNT
ncbi:putative exonuclease, partial [Escherichia coli CB7326]